VEVPVTNGRSLKLLHDGLRIENEIFWRGLAGWYEGASMRAWCVLARKANVIFDVGAYRGVYALAAKVSNPRALVYAFEPAPELYRKLTANVTLNGLDIRCVPAAAWREDGEESFFNRSDADSSIGSLLPGALAAAHDLTTTRVRTVSLEHFIGSEDLPGVDLIKLDVEGAETDVLAGLGAALRTSLPSLVVEVLTDDAAGKLGAAVAGLPYAWFDIGDSRVPVAIPRPARATRFNLLGCRYEVATDLLRQLDRSTGPA
jgi:FkbM family methyltransferase